MFELSSTTEILARAIDACALRQAVYSSNIANANSVDYRRLEVQFDPEVMRAEVNAATAFGGSAADAPYGHTAEVVKTTESVRLDEEMAAMAHNAMRYQMLLGLYEKSFASVRIAIHEGRGG